jgi:hypothetical protein
MSRLDLELAGLFDELTTWTNDAVAGSCDSLSSRQQEVRVSARNSHNSYDSASTLIR